MLERPSHRPLDNHRLFASHDVDDARMRVASIYCDHRLTPCERGGRVDAWQNAIKLKRMTLGAMSYGAEVNVEPGRLENFYLMMLPYSGQAAIETEAGRVDANDRVGTMLNPTEHVIMRWSADCAKLMVRIERDAIERHMSAMLGRPLRQPLNFRPAISRNGHGDSWWQFVQLLIAHIENQSQLANHSATLDHLETALISSLLEGQSHNYSEALHGRHCNVAPRHVRLVENYIEDHAAEPIGMEDLVQISGVSGRALYDGFRRFRDTSPMAHLRTVRLRRVRDDLLEAPDVATVSEIASRWGFFEFGRFAGHYRQMFGETPSQTMRRR
jgi:AraC-like DNA-binding protein